MDTSEQLKMISEAFAEAGISFTVGYEGRLADEVSISLMKGTIQFIANAGKIVVSIY